MLKKSTKYYIVKLYGNTKIEREGKPMKKTILSIIFILILLLVPSMVFAAEGNVAKIGETEYATLEEAVEAANSGTATTITLLKNAEIAGPISVTGNVTLNLNGATITPKEGFVAQQGDHKHNSLLLVVSGGNLTIEDTTGNGKISANGNTVVYTAVQVTKKGEYDENKTAKLVVNGGTLEGYYYGIAGNGDRHNTEVTINGGLITCQATTGVGIFQPQLGKVTVNGGSIVGATGIEIRSGELVVEKGTIKGTGIPTSSKPNGSGTTSIGAGIAVAQHTTKLENKVVVNGGTVQGYSAVYEKNPQANDKEAVAKVSMAINNGKFEVINGGTVVVESENKTKFIAGGTFNEDVEAKYLVEDVTSEKDANGNYVVGTRHSVVVGNITNGTVKASVEKALEGETVTLTVTPAVGYELSKLTVLNADNNAVEVTDGKFAMPAGGATITAEFSKVKIDYVVPEDKTENNNIGVVESEDIQENLETSLKADEKLNQKVEDAREKGEKVTVKVEVEELEKANVKEEDKQMILQNVKENQKVHQYFDISVLVATEKEKLGNLTQLKEKMKFSMKISKDLIQEGRTFYILKLHEDKVERIEGKLNKEELYLEFELDQFSLFALAYEDTSAGAPGEAEGEDGKTEEKLPAAGEKDDTPKTGAINIPVYVWVSIAGMALVGIVTTKKQRSKHSK